MRRLLSAAHVVTVTGPGGVGKSTLVLRVAHKIGRAFADGVWMVELAALESADFLPHALAQTMRVHEQPRCAIEDTLLAHLRERRLLLILDNCEHLAEACSELVGSVVSRCDDVRILCTSRQRLGVAGEAVVVLSGLEAPPGGERLSTARAGDVEALRLLVDRAVAVAPDFELSEANLEAAGEICRRLDGLPLAIELAAVRLASMTADDLVARLDDRFQLLAADPRAGSDHNQTLRATVDWSHDLLGDEERVLWRRVSVFAGGFGLKAAEAVCSGEGLERERIVDVVGSLVGKSILTMGAGGGQGRYRLLDTLRLYGTQRLRDAGEDRDLRHRHLEWCAELVSGGQQPWWARPDQADVLDVLDTEWANVEAALQLCVGSPTDAEIGLRMAADLWLYWTVRGRYRVGCRHLEVLLAITPARSATRAMALWALGWLAQATDDYAAALDRFEEARRVSTEVGGDREQAYALCGLGLVRLRLGDTEAAAQLFLASHQTMTAVGDPVGQALGLNFLATSAIVADQLTDARRLAREALDAIEPVGDSMFSAVLGAMSGIVEWRLGETETGEAKLKEAVLIQQRIDHRWGMVTSLEGLAWVAASSGRLQRAAQLLGASAALLDELRIGLVPYWQALHDRCDADARAGLGEARFRALWEEGRALGRSELLALALEMTAPAQPPSRPLSPEEEGLDLSARELEVARMVARGLSNPAIAAALFLSVATVKTHVSHILQKLGLESRVQVASWIAGHDSLTPNA